ncbi:TPA: hypothetical protein N2E01_000283 [Clostridium botulinum]|nr:hypothetical protein [Clostridium botulinum]HCL4445534.1 hypothetical protein [Clostridium botulinum]HCL4450177.1 hypothetical protein [Clostridium botulinum]HCL4457020.1 hypothetical protein [Clostridium botulinum]HCL4460706.1 hypothetical protein [Clostridium botulinum]HCL4464207.1 hypothetical protein [Clostridium botulinum]
MGLAWNLYKKSDLNNYIAYESVLSNTMIGKCKVDPGKYYLYAYKYSGNSGNYSLIIK